MIGWRSLAPALEPTWRSGINGTQAVSDRWKGLHASTQTRVKVGALIVVTVVAYHYSLSSLLQTVGVDTPLAYVGLVPLFAAGLALLHRVPRNFEPQIHDRELDYILGLPLVGAALAMVLILPGHMGAMYWVKRLDLLSLPIFVAGATILLFGTRVAWRQKAAILYLFLAWPWPYTSVLLGTLGGFTSITLSALRAILNIVPLAHPVAGPANAGLFEVVHNGHSFPVSVVTACSGIDGMVGFFLVGAGFAAVVNGPVIRKSLWLAVGLVLLWSTNLMRLLLIFGVGELAGKQLAISVLHPIAGLLFFCIGLILMMLLLKPFGLRIADAAAVPRSGTSVAQMETRPPATSRVFAAVGILALVGVVLGVNNSSLTAFDPVATAAGEPRLGSFLAQPASPAGWRAAYVAEYSISKPLFGESSRWFRYLYSQYAPSGGLSSTLPVTADVINAGGLSGFDNFGVEACYSFHGYSLNDVAKVDLGGGITGQALSYSGGHSQDWTLVYWIWPVKTSSGTRYERITLFLQNTQGAQVSVPRTAANVRGLAGALSASDPVQRRLLTNRAFLVAFARDIVTIQEKAREVAVDIGALRPALGDQVTAPGVAVPTAGLHSVVAGPDWSQVRPPVSLTPAQWYRVFHGVPPITPRIK